MQLSVLKVLVVVIIKYQYISSYTKESLRKFPLVDSYMLEVMKRLSLARQIDKMMRINSRVI